MYRRIGTLVLLFLWGCDADETASRTTCGSGTALNAEGTQCVRVLDEDQPDRIGCGPGTLRDETTGTCVGTAEAPTCGRGTELSADERACVLIDPNPTCGAGTQLAEDGLRCIPLPPTGPLACGWGTTRLTDGPCALESDAYFAGGRPLTEADRDFRVRQVEMSADGVAHFLRDEGARGIARWDLTSNERLPDIPTTRGARSLAIDPASGDLFVGDSSGRVDRISAATGVRTTVLRLGATAEYMGVHEGLLRISAGDPLGLLFFDVATLAEIPSVGADPYGQTNTMIGIEGQLIWTNRRSTLRSGLHRARVTDDGVEVEPYGDNAELTKAPLRRLPGQHLLIGGDGAVVNFDEDTIVGSIGLSFEDAVVTDTHIYLISGAASGSLITVLTHDFEQVFQREQTGTPHRMLKSADGVFAVSIYFFSTVYAEAVVLP